MDTARRYRQFAAREARGQSAVYERLALAVAEDPVVLRLLAELAEPKRQPNLLFAAVRFLGGPVEEPAAFHDWVVRHWGEVAATMRARRTQTNEAGRCAVLLPVLARLPQPLALLEVGASAGLCLYPDAYRYRYGERPVGPPDSPVLLDCTVEGAVPVPEVMPTVVWRAGLDLNPLDLSCAEDLRWLDALVWPGQEHRRARLHAAATVARADPPRIERGDLLADLPALAASAPADATLVVFHSSVLAYVPAQTRDAFAAVVARLPGYWISNEGAGAFPDQVGVPPAARQGPALSVLSLDGVPVALSGPHGQTLRWLGT